MTAPWPHFSEDEKQAALEVLNSGKVNYWTGDRGKLFEKEFAEFVGVKYAVAMSNGTVTLEAALRVLGVGAGDEVIVSPKTFIATASAVVMCGATPIFADIDRVSQNITPKTILEKITSKTKAIIPVHLAGWPCEMDAIMELAAKHNLFVIEDCAQAHGAVYKSKKVGAWGHISSFSFCQDKIMTTGGEGGMVTTNDEELWKKLWSIKDHGKDYDVVFNKQHPPGFRWLHEEFGTNWRMTEMQAAIGRKQLEKLPKWLSARRKYTDMFNAAFEKIPGFRVAKQGTEVEHACYKYYVFVESDKLAQGWDRDRIMQEVNAQGVQCFSGSCSEIYLEKCFEKYHLQPEKSLPIAHELSKTSLMFLVHPTLNENDIQRAIDVVTNIVKSLTSNLEKVVKS